MVFQNEIAFVTSKLRRIGANKKLVSLRKMIVVNTNSQMTDFGSFYELDKAIGTRGT